MTGASVVPGASPDRLRIAETRRRLGAHVGEAAALMAPTRLVADGVDAVKAEVGAQMAGASHLVSAMASTVAAAGTRQPTLTTMIAGAAVSLVLGLLTRRRTRLLPPGGANAGGALRSRSPWIGLALTLLTAYLRRPARSVH